MLCVLPGNQTNDVGVASYHDLFGICLPCLQITLLIAECSLTKQTMNSTTCANTCRDFLITLLHKKRTKKCIHWHHK